MQLLQPLQYQSMFVPTNIGLLNDKIMRRENEYLQNEAAIAAAEDQYAQIASHPSAIPYKTELLSKFGQDVNKMIEDYGGDIGAIDKRTLINKMNSIRPEIQMIQQHKQAVDAENALRLKHGADFDIQSSVGDFESWSTGRSPKTTKYGLISDYQKYVNENYDDLAKRREMGALYDSTVKGKEDYIGQNTYLGILEDQIPEYQNKIYSDLIQNKGASEGVARSIADAKGAALYQGILRQYNLDPVALARAKKNMETPTVEPKVYEEGLGMISPYQTPTTEQFTEQQSILAANKAKKEAMAVLAKDPYNVENLQKLSDLYNLGEKIMRWSKGASADPETFYKNELARVEKQEQNAYNDFTDNPRIKPFADAIEQYNQLLPKDQQLSLEDKYQILQNRFEGSSIEAPTAISFRSPSGGDDSEAAYKVKTVIRRGLVGKNYKSLSNQISVSDPTKNKERKRSAQKLDDEEQLVELNKLLNDKNSIVRFIPNGGYFEVQDPETQKVYTIGADVITDKDVRAAINNSIGAISELPGKYDVKYKNKDLIKEVYLSPETMTFDTRYYITANGQTEFLNPLVFDYQDIYNVTNDNSLQSLGKTLGIGIDYQPSKVGE